MRSFNMQIRWAITINCPFFISLNRTASSPTKKELRIWWFPACLLLRRATLKDQESNHGTAVTSNYYKKSWRIRNARFAARKKFIHIIWYLSAGKCSWIIMKMQKIYAISTRKQIHHLKTNTRTGTIHAKWQTFKFE